MAVTQGTWNVGGINLPDLGITEYLSGGLGLPQNPAYTNPLQTQTTSPGGGGGGGSYSIYGPQLPTPTTTKTPTTTNNNGQILGTNTNTGGGGGGGSGWSWSESLANAYQSQTGQPGASMPYGWTPSSGGGGGGVEDQTALINEAYNPAYSNLNAVEQLYRQEYPTAQKALQQGQLEAQNQLTTEEQSKMTNVDTQRRKNKTEEKGQFDTARQKYNELRQGLLTRFGGASSTGEATQELLGRATSQEMGGIESNFGNLYSEMAGEEKNIQNFYIDKKKALESATSLKLEQLKNTFDAQIADINRQRGVLDAAKAQARLSVVQQFAAEARQVQYDAAKFTQQLEAWKQAKDEVIQLAAQYGAKSFTTPSMPGVMGGFSVSGMNGGNEGATGSVYTDEQLRAMNLQPSGYNAKTGALTWGANNNTSDLDLNSLADRLSQE